MDFGRVQENELGKIDFALPKEPTFNKTILPGKTAIKPKVYIGCSKWGRTEWLGKIYPPKTKEKEFLDHYVQHFNSIELQATHYKIYGVDTITKWTEKAGTIDFKFSPKIYQGISHRGSLRGKSFVSGQFFKSILVFKEHLAPIFIQLSETFSPKRKDELFEFLESLPKDLEFFLEVRHKDWFEKTEVWKELMMKLKKLNIGAVITDTAGRRDAAHMYLTVPKVHIRYVGNEMHPTDDKRLNDWVNRIKYWLQHGIEEVYFYIHNHDEKLSPEMVAFLIDRLNEECGLNLKKPKFIVEPKQKGLFD